MKFDICLMNPPYDQGLCDRFLNKVLDISDIVVSVQPTTWLLGKTPMKSIINQVNDCYFNLSLINPNCFNDTSFFKKLGIHYINTTKQKEYIVDNEITGATYSYNNLSDITELSMDKELSEFNEQIKSLYNKDNFHNHLLNVYNKDNNNLKALNKPFIRITGIRGNVDKKTSNYKDDFFTFISNSDSEINNKRIFNTTSNIDLTDEKGKRLYNLVFVFNDNLSRQNCINYMKSDFCRGSLMLSKTNQHLDTGELKTVPWFDFSDKHFSKTPKEIDDYLFKKFNISDDIRKHIEEILPDYYGIRN